MEGEPNGDLYDKVGGGGFPAFLVLDAEGKVLWRHAGERTVAAFETTIDKSAAYLGALKKAAEGDKSAGIDVAIAELEQGTLTEEAAKKKIAELGEPTPEQQARFDAVVVNAEVMRISQELGKDRVAAGREFLEMKEAGRIPDGYKETDIFWNRILDYAESEKNAKLFEEGLNKLKAKFASNPNTKKFFELKDETLKKLKSGK
ncbi:MAG: hypothetical protein HYY18_00800 [Planctomycetes bacterium]|nr:hypothetical protein [Planctomycetota bacterium]